MKKVLATLFIAVLAIGITSCNKTKKVSNRFIKPGEWTVTEMSVDGTNEDELPKWEIDDCDIYGSSCMGHWENDEGGHADFVWQFRDKGETFEISYQAEEEAGHTHDHADEEVAAQAYSFSGVYTVETSKKDEMTFTTTAAVGFPGQTVKIKIEKAS